MKIAVQDAGVCVKDLRVEVGSDTVASAREQVYADLQRVARVPGFRVGKAPRDLVIQHYGAKAREETIHRVIREYLPKALQESKLDLLGDPEVTQVTLDDGHPMVPPPVLGPSGRPDGAPPLAGQTGGGMAFTARCEVMPAIQIRQTRGWKVKRPAAVVTETQVAEVIAQLQERHAELVPVDPRPLAAGEYAVVDFTCAVEGKTIEQRNGAVLVIKPDEDTSGMSRQLVGKTPGPDPVTFQSQLPQDLPAKTYADKPATFTVTLKEIKVKRVPPADDELAKLAGADSLQTLQGRIREDLMRALTARSRRTVEEQLLQQLVDQARFDVPPSLVQSQAERLLREAQLRLMYQGTAPEEVQGQRELLAEQSKRDALRQVKIFFLLRQLAKDHQLTATEPEVEARVQALAAQHQRSPEQVRADLHKERLLGELVWDITRGKVMEKLLAQANIEEATP